MSPSSESILSSKLREERLKRGMTLADFAARLSEQLGGAIDKSAIARVERGERGVKLDEAVGMAKVLRLPLMSLLETEDVRDAEILRAQAEVDNAALLLEAAENDVVRYSTQLEEARARLEELERREKSEELLVEQWPLGD